MKTVLISGGSGMIGTRLTELLLEKGFKVIILGRGASYNKITHQNLLYSQWKVKEGYIDKEVVAASNFIIHLAGANVAEKRWTKKRKKEILESRTKSAELLIDALFSVENNVEAFVSASAIGYYGPDKSPGLAFKENDKPGDDFLARVCVEWENSVKPVEKRGVRLAILRTGLVVSRKEGLLKKFLPVIKCRVAPVLGSGTQMMSTIHLDDMCKMYIFALENSLEGIYNAASPEICTNRKFISLATRLLVGRLFIKISVPAFLLKAVMGELAVEILKSTSVDVEKIQSAAFHYVYPTVEDQLRKEINETEK